MKTPTTGKFDSREELEAFVIKSHAETGSLAKTARAAGISTTAMAKIQKAHRESMDTPMICPDCKIPPAQEYVIGLTVYQCPDCGECGKATKSTSQALITWNNRVALRKAHLHPTTGRSF